jgi:hypothetical protein
MVYKSSISKHSEAEAFDFEVISENASGISCDAGIVTIPKSNFGHLAVDESEYILMKYLKIESNKAEVPQTVLLKARRVANDVRISCQFENYIFDDENAAYLDLLQRPNPVS